MIEYTGNIRYDTFCKVTAGDTSGKWGTPPIYPLWLYDQVPEAMGAYLSSGLGLWSDKPEHFIGLYPEFFDRWLKETYWSRDELYRWGGLTAHLK